ncbi:hypothetical protein GPALN_009728 [Globodera pallida]|nr:hypothetical protein GPALN_009728 [Globodera pallida]
MVEMEVRMRQTYPAPKRTRRPNVSAQTYPIGGTVRFSVPVECCRLNAASGALKKKITRELITTILARKPKMCAFLEYKDMKIVYKRYASLYFCCAIEQTDNEVGVMFFFLFIVIRPDF